ncbi:MULTISPECIES: HlyD family type I secretion periplasmic adaptor subunit [unclassified Oleiphilus]|uniref:HlyD family type I secretion periplasmic adaptor subunit n=3 Tax=Oleiphilus TaxID=141450 RepID=UPI0009ED39B4|nr:MULTISPECIES: HlyD family type I secretion periplasmic adaptor subunit [unclassified Oleiphilus]
MSSSIQLPVGDVSEEKTKKGLFAFLHKDQSVSHKELYQFLPAAIEVEQTPASSAGRAIIWAIVILFTIACVWAYFGKIDIVAVAQGKVIPSEHIKHIQPLEAGKIKAIHVREGQSVKQGEPLITLDSTQTQADVDRLAHEIAELSMNIERLSHFDHWLSLVLKGVGSQALAPLKSTSHQNLLVQQKTELNAKLSSLEVERQKLQAEQQMVEAEATKKERVIPVLAERVDALEQLHRKDYGSKLPYLELKQELIEQEQDLKVQQARFKQLDSSILAIEKQTHSLLAEQQLATLSQKQEFELRLEGLKQELVKAKQRNQQQAIVSPIDGQVQQLAVHTIGGVVTPAQALLVIVPDQSKMEVDVMILNKDIGFVQEGQKAEVKVDTFNFTKYGLIDAEIKSISDDAIQDENLGLVYSARVALAKEQLVVEGREVKLSPGMSVMAEVKTGKRRLIEYFLSPLLRYKQESLGER